MTEKRRVGISEGGRIRAVDRVCAASVVALGFGSRRYGAYLPAFVAQYAGDRLWALMVFLGFGVIAPTSPTSHRAGLALVASYAVEVSQLYHAPWIDSLRQTRIGGLVLGLGFLWSDIVGYSVGVGVGAGMEVMLTRPGGGDPERGRAR